jgi:hypothetical protein
MRAALLIKAVSYLILGVLFIVLATNSAGEGLWNVTTVILMIVTALSFLAFFRLLYRYIRTPKQ